jgi:hypothetical protein
MRNYGSHPEDVRNKSEDMMKGYGDTKQEALETPIIA